MIFLFTTVAMCWASLFGYIMGLTHERNRILDVMEKEYELKALQNKK